MLKCVVSKIWATHHGKGCVRRSWFVPVLVALTLTAGAASAASHEGRPLIGPFYTGDPESLVMIPNPHAEHPVAYNLSIGWVDHGHYLHGYRGVARYQWHLRGMLWGRQSGTSRMHWIIGRTNQIHLQWQRIIGTDTVVATLKVDKPVKIVLECYPAWPGYGATYSIHDGKVVGEPKNSGAAAPGFMLEASHPAARAVTANSPMTFAADVVHGTGEYSKPAPFAGLVFDVEPGDPLKFVAALAPAQTDALVDASRIIKQGWTHYLAQRPHATGDWGNFVSPISVAANESVVYVPVLHNLSATVVRGWCLPGGCVLFEWDSFFNSVLLSVNNQSVCPWLTRRQLAGTFHFQMGNGAVCNFANWNGRSTPDRSEPPVAAMCVWQAYQRWPSKNLLRSFYHSLVRYHHWWFAINPETHLPYRDGNRDRLLEWGSNGNGLNWSAARLESGMDDTPMYLPSKVHMTASQTFDVDDVGLNSLWAADAMYLSKIAWVLGHRKASAHYATQWHSMAARINAMLWSRKFGMYCNRYWSRGKGHHLLSRVWSPTNFYPMIAKIPDQHRINRVLAVMLNKQYFWGKWVIPTIARNTPFYKQQEYWRGDIWGPTNYLVFEGLLNDAPAPVIHAFARKSVKLFMDNWNRTGVWSENYLSTTGIAAHDRHYSWGALLPTIGLQAICAVDLDGKVRVDGTWDLHEKLYNIPLLGYRYTIVVRPHRTELLRAGKVVAIADNTVAYVMLPERHLR